MKHDARCGLPNVCEEHRAKVDAAMEPPKRKTVRWISYGTPYKTPDRYKYLIVDDVVTEPASRAATATEVSETVGWMLPPLKFEVGLLDPNRRIQVKEDRPMQYDPKKKSLWRVANSNSLHYFEVFVFSRTPEKALELGRPTIEARLAEVRKTTTAPNGGHVVSPTDLVVRFVSQDVKVA